MLYLFLVVGTVHTTKRTVPASEEQLPDGIIKDTREAFMVRNVRDYEIMVPAFTAEAAIGKVRKSRILMEEATAHNMGRAFRKRRWSDKANKGHGGFVYLAPSYADTVPHPDHPAHVRLASVHERLTTPASANERIAAYSEGWKAAQAAYTPNKKNHAASLKAAKYTGTYADDFKAGFLKRWAMLASKKAPKPTPKASRKFKTKTPTAAACTGV